MTQPLAPVERDEVADLLAECEDRDTLRVRLAELLRLRGLAGTCRAHRERLPHPVRRVLDERVPRLNQQQQWARAVAANDDQPDPRAIGTPRLI